MVLKYFLSRNSYVGQGKFSPKGFYQLIFLYTFLFYNCFNTKIYFRHLVKYILLLRILSQDIITPEDIEFTKILVDEFLSDFADLYGEINMTFNLHCLQHLPNQVQKYGPLHKCDCFPFEGWFKNTKLLHNGTSAKVSLTHL